MLTRARKPFTGRQTFPARNTLRGLLTGPAASLGLDFCVRAGAIAAAITVAVPPLPRLAK